MYIPYIDFPYLDPQSPSVKNKILECGAITKQNLKNNMLINYLYWTTNVLFMWNVLFMLNLLFKWIQEESFLMNLSSLRKIPHKNEKNIQWLCKQTQHMSAS
jgi:hypothetical protein